MAQIKVLDSLVADMIAAGEVVERPASVVKELAENAIDAGAGKVIIEIKNGGVSFLRITDDGSGIAADDLQTAFLRHATSKIEQAEDLFAIGTLGFRGEALASIAAVSVVEVFTKPARQQFGMYLRMKAGQTEDSHEAGCPDGTTFTVRDLFFNQPARMKFLKKDAAEAAAVQDVIIHLALGNPGISFRFISDGKEKLHTPGDGNLKNCIYALYGREYTEQLAELQYTGDGVTVTGFCGTPAIARSNRNYQTFFVNGRLIKSRSMTATLEQAYQDGMMKGKYPFGVVMVDLEPSLTDVNVHPAKLEVKFSNEKAVTSTVYWAVKNALFGKNYRPHIELPENKLPENEQKTTPSAKTSFSETLTQKKTISKADVRQDSGAETKTSFVPVWLESRKKEPVRDIPNETLEIPQDSLRQPVIRLKKEEPEKQDCVVQVQTKTGQPCGQIRILGQLFQSYLVAEREDELLLIDQHAAHERFLFEELLQQRKTGQTITQTLLIPIIFDMTVSDFENVREHLSELLAIGFELEEFGEHSYRMVGVPAGCEGQDAENFFWETYRAMQCAGDRGTTESELLYSIACHKALKANHSLHPKEMEEMVKAVMELPSTCPHGRPIVITMTKTMIEKQFKRIV